MTMTNNPKKPNPAIKEALQAKYSIRAFRALALGAE
jgi:hypothetical protein